MKEQNVTHFCSVTSSHYVSYKFLNPDVLFSTRAKNNIWLNALRAFNQAGEKSLLLCLFYEGQVILVLFTVLILLFALEASTLL